MEKINLLTTVKRFRVLILLVLSVFILGGCGGELTPIDSGSTGFFDQYFVYPFSLLIKQVAGLFGGSFGVAIVLITIGIRLVLMPFFIKQSKTSRESKGKMELIKPEMDAIQAKYKGNKNPEAQADMQREMAAVYKEHNFNPLKMVTGCLPIILQMPILIGFYYAIRRTPEIAEQSFFWFNLGEVNLLMVLIAAVIYLIQSGVSLIGLEAAQRKQMMIMGLLSPIMIGVISLSLPAALPLYWAVSGGFMIVQTLIVKKMYP